jgi:hypothetical protein
MTSTIHLDLQEERFYDETGAPAFTRKNGVRFSHLAAGNPVREYVAERRRGVPLDPPRNVSPWSLQQAEPWASEMAHE